MREVQAFLPSVNYLNYLQSVQAITQIPKPKLRGFYLNAVLYGIKVTELWNSFSKTEAYSKIRAALTEHPGTQRCPKVYEGFVS